MSKHHATTPAAFREPHPRTPASPGNGKRFRWNAFIAHTGDRSRYPLLAAAASGGWAGLWMPTTRTALRKAVWIRLGSTGASEYFLPRALGCCNRPWPSARSLCWICRTGAGGARGETAAASAPRACGAGGLQARPTRTPHQDSPGGLAVVGDQLCHGLDRVGLLGSALGTVVVF